MNLGNLGGLFQASDDLGFNEVISSCYFPINVATGVTTDYPIPISFASTSELDVVFTNFSPSQPSNVSASGSPDGLACQLCYGSSTFFGNFSIVGSALRVTATGGSVGGAVRILRRNRRVKAYAALAASTTETTLPFTVSDPHRTMLVTSSAATPAFSHSFLDEYISSADTTAWHLVPFSGAKVKVTSSSTYMTSTTSAPNVTIVEFDTP